MKRYASNIIILLSSFLLFMGCATTEFKHYEPKSVEEEMIIKFLLKCDEAFEDQDIINHMNCFDDSAQIRIWLGEDLENNPEGGAPRCLYRAFRRGSGRRRACCEVQPAASPRQAAYARLCRS